jgi:hypothetical protein
MELAQDWLGKTGYSDASPWTNRLIFEMGEEP